MQSHNAYAYTQNNPTNASDPSGLWCSAAVEDRDTPCNPSNDPALAGPLSGYNPFDLMSIPTQIGTLYTFEASTKFQFNNFSLDELLGLASQNEIDLLYATPVYDWLLPTGGLSGGGGEQFGGGTLTGAIKQLKAFKTDLKNCLADLNAVGLTPKIIQDDASSVRMVNALTKPAILARMDSKADFSVVDGAPTPTLAFNPANYWQTSFGDLLGTLVHEYAHLTNPGPSGTDQALIKALGIVGATNTNDISKKFGKDCFPGAKP